MEHSALTVRPAVSGEDLTHARRLFRAYGATPGVAECVARLDEEINGLPGRYGLPQKGALLLAWHEGVPVGCAALRRFNDWACEMKRLFVLPEARGSGAGRALATAALTHARALGYTHIRLDTLPSMREAAGLYRSLGFLEIGCYYDGAPPDALFFERAL